MTQFYVLKDMSLQRGKSVQIMDAPLVSETYYISLLTNTEWCQDDFNGPFNREIAILKSYVVLKVAWDNLNKQMGNTRYYLETALQELEK